MFVSVTRAPEERDSIMLTYLNPLVLRKELENMFENDGVDTLLSPDIAQKKSIIFWNLVSMKGYVLVSNHHSVRPPGRLVNQLNPAFSVQSERLIISRLC